MFCDRFGDSTYLPLLFPAAAASWRNLDMVAAEGSFLLPLLLRRFGLVT